VRPVWHRLTGAVSTGRVVTTTAVPAMVLQVVESGCDGMTINWPDWVKTLKG